MSKVWAYATNDKFERDDVEFLCTKCFNDPDVPASRKWHFNVPVTTRFLAKSPCLNCGRDLKGV